MAELFEAALVEKLVAWPTPQDYNEAVQSPEFCFSSPDLRAAVAAVNEFGLPRPISGGFASVYRLRSGEREFAVRCFLNRLSDRQERYGEIMRYIETAAPPWAVPCEFLPEGMMIGSTWYPILKMQWVKGETLGAWVERHLQDPQRLRDMRARLTNLVSHLQETGVAHGDLQPANIIILADDSLKLVDYDGMFVPTLAGSEANELGHRNFQHPARTGRDFNATLDNFSTWLLNASIEILACDPALWQTMQCGDDAILFRHADLADPDHSYAFSVLENHFDARIVACARAIRSMCRNALDMVPAPTAGFDVPGDLPDVVYVPPNPVQEPPATIQVVPRPLPKRRSAPAKRRTQKNSTPTVSVDLLLRLASEPDRTKRIIIYPALAMTALLVGTIMFIQIQTHNNPYHYFHLLMMPPGQKLLEDANEDYERGISVSAVKKYEELIRRYPEPGFGLKPPELLEALVRHAESERVSGLPEQALDSFRKAQSFAKRSELLDPNKSTTEFDPTYFAFQKLLCEARMPGGLEKAADGLAALFTENPGSADLDVAETMKVFRSFEEQDTMAALKFWSAWLNARVKSDPAVVHEMARDVFGFAHQSWQPVKHDLLTVKDLLRAKEIYSTLNTALAAQGDDYLDDRMEALGGIFYCDIKLGNKKDAAAIRKLMNELDNSINVDLYGLNPPRLG